MKLKLKPLALAMLVAATPLVGATYAQAPKVATAPLVQPAQTTTKAPIPIRTPDDWIVYDGITYTPVVDAVSQHLNAARHALDAKDDKLAAAEMRAVADQLKLQAARAGAGNKALVTDDKALLAGDIKFAQDTTKRMNASAQKASAAAAAIESGKIKTRADLDKTIDRAARADMERRWLVTDVTTWYPVSEEPQHHFTSAVAAYARKDYKAAATEIRKATGYLRLEASRATGDARHELDSSVAQLDKLAAALERGEIKREQSMHAIFARADHALALEHRAKAAESWVRKDYEKSGYELKAAAQALEGAAGWVGGEAKAGASATVADTRALGGELASGATSARDAFAKGLESLGNGINALGRKIGGTKKASAFVSGA